MSANTGTAPGSTGQDSAATSVLDSIFGDGWENFLHLAQNGASTSGDASSALGAMFMLFNGAVMAATAIIVFYSVAVGIAQTAHEGVVLGKRYSSLWMPIRSVMGGALIAPVIGGFSLIQAIILMMASMSISFADLTFNKLLDWMGKGEPIVQMSKVTGMTMSSNVIPQILEAELCKAYYQEKENIQVLPLWEEDTSFFEKGSFTKGVNVLVYRVQNNGLYLPDSPVGNVKNQICGKFAILSMDDMSNKLIMSAMDDVRNTLSEVGKNIANSQENMDNSRLVAAMQRWEQLQKDVGLEAAANTKTQYQNKLNEFKQAATVEGWIKAGQWYWVLSSLNSEFHNKATITVDYTPATIETADPNSEEMGGISNTRPGC
jgi:conjugal transfer/type IV secretion protein DotA/TraY